MALHGGINARKRTEIYDAFCNKQFAALFATDVAARGLDFPSVDWVVQLDCAADAEEYIHRSGRTARYNRKGEAILVLTPFQEQPMLAALQAKKVPIQKISVNTMRLTSISKSMEGLCAAETVVKDFAQKALVSYVKSVHLMRNKAVFNVNSVNVDLLAKSFGLAFAPRLRFLRSKNSTENNSKSRRVENEMVNTFRADDVEDGDDDLFSIKPRDRVPAQDIQKVEIDEQLEPSTRVKADQTSAESSKVITKAAAARKAIKSRFKINKKLIFADEQMQRHTNNEPEDVKADSVEEENAGGLDIDKAIESMKKADDTDRLSFKERLKAKKRERRQKLKEREARKKRKRFETMEQDEIEDGEMQVVLGSADDSDAQSSASDSNDDDPVEKKTKLDRVIDSDLRLQEDIALKLLES